MFNLFHTFATVGGVERAIPVGSSCLNEGDGICETNADPWGRGMGDLASFNAGGVAVQKNGCGLTYVGQLRDPANYLYTRPLPMDNQMSYYYGYFINEPCDQFRFVTEQNDKSILFVRARQTGTNANLGGRPSVTQAPVLTTTSQLSRYTLSWPKITGALGYIVERSTNPTFTSYEVIAGLDANATSYTDNEVSSAGSTVYYYRIRASNSTAYSCPGAITPTLIVNSTPLSSTTVTNRWWGDYAKKATKWGLMANSQFPTTGNLPTLTASDAANVVVRAAKSLGFTAYQSLTFSCGEESNAAYYYLRSRGIIPSLLLPTSIITLGQSSSMIGAVILNGNGIIHPQRASRNNSGFSVNPGPYAVAINRLIRTVVKRSSAGGSQTEWMLSGPASGATAIPITGNETIGQATLAKLVTGAYEAKYFAINRQTRQARIATTDLAKAGAIGEDPEDYILIGDQNEFETETDGEVPSSITATGATVSIRSGESFTYGASSNTTPNGTRVYFFWSVDGVSAGVQMVPITSDFRQIRFTAPNVNSPQTFHLYVYLALSNGNRAELYTDIIVSPTSTTGSTGGSSGNLSRIEYFLDNDPGLGPARPVGGVGSNDQTVDIPIDLSGYTGLHVFSVRARDTQGRWSHTHSRPLLISAGGVPLPITGIEYFFDTDPGYDLATPIPIAPDATTYASDLGLSAEGLSTGLHTLHLRVKNSAGGWSHTHVRPVVILGSLAGNANTLDRVEYFVDNDPGFGNGQQAQLPPGTTNLADVAIPLNLTTLSGGLHVFSVRVRNQTGQWSATHSRPFIILPTISSQITRVECYVDTDPGEGRGQTMPFTPNPGSDVVALLDLPLAGLPTGRHQLYVRAKDNAGRWSATQSASFTMLTSCSSPTAVLTGSQTITSGQAATLLVAFTGSSPWNLTLSNGQSFSNISSSPLAFTTSPVNTTTYTIGGVSNACGVGLSTGQVVVTVRATLCTSMYSVKSGDWNDPTVWSCNRVPTSTDAVEIRHSVTMPATTTGAARQVQYAGGGKLILTTGAKLRLDF